MRVVVLSHFGTLTFSEAWRTRVDAKFWAVDAHYLGRAQLIAEKTFFDRPQDPDITHASMRTAHQLFVEQALSALE